LLEVGKQAKLGFCILIDLWDTPVQAACGRSVMEPAPGTQFCLKFLFSLKQGLLGSGELGRRRPVSDLAEEPVSGLPQPFRKFAEGC
jgi:hypothetical protein